MQISPWDTVFTRPELRQETKEFPLPDGRKFKLTLKELDALGEGQAYDRREEYVQRHVINQEPLLSPLGDTMPASKSVLSIIAALETMQVPEPGQQPYGLLDWMGFAQRVPTLWEPVVGWLNSFGPEDADDPNPTGSDQGTTAPTGSSSESSPATDSPTPN